MADPSTMKGQGMRFAEELLQRHGWTEGKGLGKRENGISEAIKVKVKCDTAGVGHNSAEQFTFHWWDHVFNKTASSISVEPDQDGVQVKKVKEDDPTVTNKKPRKAFTNRNMLYGRFIKSATLLSGGEKPVEKESSSESSDSSEDEDEKLDLSSTTKLTDEDLMKICGGRTAHKGARHGLKMSAKLSRIEEQERAFLEKYRKKEPKKEAAKPTTLSSMEEDTKAGKEKKRHKQDMTKDVQKTVFDTKSSKKKKKKPSDDKTVQEVVSSGCYKGLISIEKDEVTSKNCIVGSEVLQDVLNGIDNDPFPRKKHATTSKKRNIVDEVLEECANEPVHLLEEDLRSSKKKKKKKALDEDVRHEFKDPKDYAQTIDAEEPSVKKMKKRKTADTEEKANGNLLDGHQDICSEDENLRDSKKKKKSLHFEDSVEKKDDSTENIQSKKKKKKKKENEVNKVEKRAVYPVENCQVSKKNKKKSTDHCTVEAESESEEAAEYAEHRIKCKKKRKNKA
ncbi:G patch domain-containing protein 4 [Hyperolius riggenbachi]|uniref:G patch domain-containing protein 4 n=1 Tax=Hyperolius riggenbachi TaxID=752182 RepID=UPI0035A2DAA5